MEIRGEPALREKVDKLGACFILRQCLSTLGIIEQSMLYIEDLTERGDASSEGVHIMKAIDQGLAITLQDGVDGVRYACKLRSMAKPFNGLELQKRLAEVLVRAYPDRKRPALAPLPEPKPVVREYVNRVLSPEPAEIADLSTRLIQDAADRKLIAETKATVAYYENEKRRIDISIDALLQSIASIEARLLSDEERARLEARIPNLKTLSLKRA